MTSELQESLGALHTPYTETQKDGDVEPPDLGDTGTGHVWLESLAIPKLTWAQ